MTKDLYPLKKQPLQKRSRFTVNTIKEAAAHILREQGLSGFNTNAVALRAGVSIGSLYQYFDSKEVLVAEIKRDHFKLLRDKIKTAYKENAHKPLGDIIHAFVKATFDAHCIDPQLHEILSGDLAEFGVKEDNQSANTVRASIEHLLEQHIDVLRPGLDIQLAARLCYILVENIAHDTVINHPEKLSSAPYEEEVTRMVMAYIIR